jgi:hypothetical protein
MQNIQPDGPLENQNNSRSLGIALGVTEYIFILGLLLLASGIYLSFGLGPALISTGCVLIFAGFYNAYTG